LNVAACRAVPSAFLAKKRGEWMSFADGTTIASRSRPGTVFTTPSSRRQNRIKNLIWNFSTTLEESCVRIGYEKHVPEVLDLFRLYPVFVGTI
jgi:hypothetical protein